MRAVSSLTIFYDRSNNNYGNEQQQQSPGKQNDVRKEPDFRNDEECSQYQQHSSNRENNRCCDSFAQRITPKRDHFHILI